MRILGIETSCDETAAAVVDDGRHVRSNVISSSQASFSGTGGVIPEEAARMQVACMLPVVHAALEKARTDWNDIDAIAVTAGPGLLGSLLVGTTAARALAYVHRKPLIGVHHTLGHLSSVWLEHQDEIRFPVLTLSASGGHTDLWVRTAHTQGTLLGATRDDAAGEAFDKAAALLHLPYPGGPSIAKAAETGDPLRIPFPQPLKKERTADFSFSGLKTALRYAIRDCTETPLPVADLAAGFQQAVCLHLASRIDHALTRHPDVTELHLVGGVSANTALRTLLQERHLGRTVRWPVAGTFCTDNAAMIAAAGYFLQHEDPSAMNAPFTTNASVPLSAAMRIAQTSHTASSRT